MLIKYFEYIAVILSVCLFLIPTITWRLRLRLKYLQKLTRINVLKRQQRCEKSVLFSSDILNRAVQKLYFSKSPKAREALIYAVGGRVSKSAVFFAESQPMLALLLSAHENADPSYKKMLKQKRLWMNTVQYCIYLPIMAHLMLDHKTLMHIIRKYDPKVSR